MKRDLPTNRSTWKRRRIPTDRPIGSATTKDWQPSETTFSQPGRSPMAQTTTVSFSAASGREAGAPADAKKTKSNYENKPLQRDPSDVVEIQHSTRQSHCTVALGSVQSRRRPELHHHRPRHLGWR